MEDLTFVEFFLFVTVLIWIFLIVISLITVHPSVLRRKGYDEEYIKFIKKDTIKRNIGIATVMPLLGAAAAFIVWLFVDDINDFQNLIYIAIIWIALVIPFPVMDMKKTNKKYRELAVQTGSEVMIDMNYRIIHLAFNPLVEFIASLVYIIYFIEFIAPFHVSFIHIFILWALYSVARSSKYLTAPHFRDGYIYLYIFLMINQFLLIFHLIREVLSKAGCEECLSGTAVYTGIILSVFLLVKFIYYLSSFPKFNLKLKSK